MKFEEGPQVRIVGNVEEKEKLELAEKQSELLLNPDAHIDQYGPNARENQARFEYLKTEIEKRIIDIANEESNDFLIGYGLKPFDVPEFAIHMVHESDLKKHKNSTRHYASTQEMAIYLNTDSARLNKVAFATAVFHEILHLKSYIALEANAGKEKPKMTGFRSGLQVSSTQANIEKNAGYHEHFRGLNEAVTSDLEKEFMLKVVFNPEKKEFEEEQKWMNSTIAMEAREKISQKEKGFILDISISITLLYIIFLIINQLF